MKTERVGEKSIAKLGISKTLEQTMEITMAETAESEKQGCDSGDILTDWSSLRAALEDAPEAALGSRGKIRLWRGWREHYLRMWFHIYIAGEAQVAVGTKLLEDHYNNGLYVLEFAAESDDLRIADLNFKLCLLMENSSRMKEALNYWTKSNAICTAKLGKLSKKRKSAHACSNDTSAFERVLLQEILVLYATKRSGSSEIKNKSSNISNSRMNDPMAAAAEAVNNHIGFRHSILSHWQKLKTFLEGDYVGKADEKKSLLSVWIHVYTLGETAIILGKMDAEFHYVEALNTLKHLVESDDIHIAYLYFKICLIRESSSRIKDALDYCRKAAKIWRLEFRRLREAKEKLAASSMSEDRLSNIMNSQERCCHGDLGRVLIIKLRQYKDIIKPGRKQKPRRKKLCLHTNPDAGRLAINTRISSNAVDDNGKSKRMKIVN